MTGGGFGGSGQADTLWVDIKGRLNDMSFRQAEREAESAGSGIKGKFGGAIAALPAIAATAAAAVGAALVGAANTAINAFADFEATLSGAQAVLGATAGEMEKLKAQALEMGATTSFSASESAKAIEELGSAGLATADILNGGLKGALDLAAATGLKDVAEAAEIAAGTMNSFGLAGSDMTRVADAVANAANISALGVKDFGYAISAGGSSAKAAGLSMEEFTASVSFMADKMIKGSDAGTSMKSFLSGLTPASDPASAALEELGISAFDAQGKMRPFPEILRQMQEGTKKLTQEQAMMAAETAFGSDGIRAYNILVAQGAEGLNKRVDALQRTGAAEEAAKIRLSNLKGDVDQMKGALESATIVIGETLTKNLNLRGVVQNITTGINTMAPLIDAGLKTILPKVSAFGGQLNTTLGPALTQASGLFKSVFTTLAPIVQAAFNAILPVIKSLGPVVTAAFGVVKALWETSLRPTLQALTPVFTLIFNSVAAVVRSAIQVITGVLNAVTALMRGDVSGAAKFLQAAFNQAGETMGKAMLAGGQAVLAALRELPGKVREIAGNIVAGLVNGIKSGVGEVGKAAANLGSSFLESISNVLDMHSPSKKTEQQGVWAHQGFTAGIWKGVPEVKKAAAGLGKAAVSELEKARAELEKDIAFDKWVDGLTSATRAQLLNAQTVARAAGDAQKYGAIKAELERREDAATAATKRATDAAKQHAEQLASNQKAITDGLKFDAYVTGLESYTAAQLNAAKANAYTAGDGQKFNAVLAEQKRRADAATQAVKDWAATLAQGIADGNAALDGLDLNQMGGRDLAAAAGPLPDVTQNFADLTARIEALKDEVNEPGVVDAWTASIEEMGKRGLITGQQVAYLKQQVQDLVNIPSEQLLPDNLQGRGIAEGTIVSPDDPATGYLTPAEREEYLNLAVEQDPAWLQAELAHMERIGKGATDLAEVYREALATIELANADALSSIQVGVDEAGNAIYATEDQLRGIGVAVDDVTESFFDLSTVDLTQFATLDALTTLAKQAQLTEADTAALVKRWLESTAAGKAHASTMEAQAAAVKAWDDNMAKLAWDDWIQSLQDFDEAQLDSAETTALLNLDTARYNAIQTERARRTRETAAADKELAATQDASRKMLTDATAELEKMITGKEVPAYEKRALALEAQAEGDEANAEALRLLAERFREVGKAAEENAAKLNVTLKIGGIDTGLKQLDLYKSAITGIADVMVDAFSNIVAGTEQGVDDVLKNMAKMALGIVKQVGVALIAYGAQAAAAALIGAATFNPVQIAAALAAGVALAALAAGLEARLGQGMGAGAMPSSAGAGVGSGTAPAPSNSLVQIPASQVTIAATPEWMTTLTKAADTQLRAAELQLQAVREGLRVTVDNTGNGGGSPMTPLAILTP